MMATNALNPIYEFARRGQRRENEGQWDRAVEWYQKSLSCLPNIFGRDTRLKHFLTPPLPSAAFSHKHAARLYASLARCLTKLGRLEDSRLAGTAARALEADRDTAPQSAPMVEPSDDAPIPRLEYDPRALDNVKADLADSLTLIVVTHCVDRLVRFKSLAPPSTGLLTATYGSLNQVFGSKIRTCPQWLCYDRPAGKSLREKAYLEGLRHFSRQQSFDLQIFDHIGLFAILERVLPRVDTPYILFVEHDWLFKGPSIRLSHVVADMNRHRHVNAVRFNKRENQINGLDYILTTSGHRRVYPLLRTSSHSNNPSLFRTDKFRDDWMPQCRRALSRVAGQLGGSAFGVEEILFRCHAADIRRMGFDEAHGAWGTYIFGGPGDPARVVHLGE